MAETEVESILREIRERVVGQERAGHGAGASIVARATGGGEGNGASDAGPAQEVTQTRGADTVTAQNLALINSYLATTARAWDRLPPLVSNRSGAAARLELWLKRHFKRATRWYAWEQVNFNAAVHHALRDMLPVLAEYERELVSLRARIDEEVTARQAETEKYQTAMATQSAETQAELKSLRLAIEAERQTSDAQRAHTNSLIAQLVSELRERDERLQGEQRVYFKQLSLETGEAAVLEDRARRKTEALLEKLAHRVEELEKK